ncbi:MAG: hypothetical protein KC583_02430, partial [Myxococcales bacterium]|nr:hypothetical protein [Myxococcales bacterium]
MGRTCLFLLCLSLPVAALAAPRLTKVSLEADDEALTFVFEAGERVGADAVEVARIKGNKVLQVSLKGVKGRKGWPLIRDRDTSSTLLTPKAGRMVFAIRFRKPLSAERVDAARVTPTDNGVRVTVPRTDETANAWLLAPTPAPTPAPAVPVPVPVPDPAPAPAPEPTPAPAPAPAPP